MFLVFCVLEAQCSLASFTTELGEKKFAKQTYEKKCNFFKWFFLNSSLKPSVPFSIPGVFKLCTIFGRMPGFELRLQPKCASNELHTSFFYLLLYCIAGCFIFRVSAVFDGPHACSYHLHQTAPDCIRRTINYWWRWGWLFFWTLPSAHLRWHRFSGLRSEWCKTCKAHFVDLPPSSLSTEFWSYLPCRGRILIRLPHKTGPR